MSLWNFMYQNQIKNIVDLVSRTDGDAGYANLNAIARIFKVYLFSILTDVYGDIPYFAAGTAYFSKDYYPKYDKQQDIYNDFLVFLGSSGFHHSTDRFRNTALLSNNLSHIIRSHFEL